MTLTTNLYYSLTSYNLLRFRCGQMFSGKMTINHKIFKSHLKSNGQLANYLSSPSSSINSSLIHQNAHSNHQNHHCSLPIKSIITNNTNYQQRQLLSNTITFNWLQLIRHFSASPNKHDDIHVIPKVKTQKDITLGRNFITTTRAMREYALDISDLVDLRKFQRRSPYNDEPPITVYLRKDVEAKALEVWKNWDCLNEELKKRKEKEEIYSDSLLIVKKYNKDYRRLNTPQAKFRENVMREAGRVVMAAVLINGANFFLKLFAWLYTGSHSLFSEAIHSFADTCNQLLLAFGIRKSIQVPNKDHPYGYHPMRYISSLISGVAIFCTGTGLSFYHGIDGLLHPAPMESYYWAYFILLGSLISEGGTLVIALNAARRSSVIKGITLKQYILSGSDPTINVVILEDFAAVLGVTIAACCMGLTSYFNTPIFDACGSLGIGALLGVVASFVIYSNAGALVGKSIPPNRMADINRLLESDSMVRAIHDVKATHMGNDMIRYKAEVDFDGRKLTRNYLDSIDLEVLFKEMKSVKTMEECEEFMLKHGENIVDLLGGEVDRIENELKAKHPEVRHVDLEVL